MSPPTRRKLSTDDYAKGVLGRDRAILGRAITLVESSAPAHAQTARDLLESLMPHTGHAIRIGITGVPGAGKSTFIERFGLNLIGEQRRVAVLAVDPSSGVTGGSILGDKTRMADLAANPDAFIRPSPSAGTLGGVASKTRESLLLCEAAGFDTVLIETVGVGQSEAVVAGMTDCFLGLFLPNAGDELQGIKRGLLELLDVIAVNKADGDNTQPAEVAAQQLRNASRYTDRDGREPPPVLTCSARTGANVDTVWQHLREFHERAGADGSLQRRRDDQAAAWMWAMIDERLRDMFRRSPEVVRALPDITKRVRRGEVPATRAADEIIEVFAKRG